MTSPANALSKLNYFLRYGVWQSSAIPGGGGGSGGTELSYAPASGNVDPGAGITGFIAGFGAGGTSALNLTLSANTTFAGLPTGSQGQTLLLSVVAGNFTLTLTSFGTTAGAQIASSGTNYQIQLNDTVMLVYSTSLTAWKLLV